MVRFVLALFLEHELIRFSPLQITLQLLTSFITVAHLLYPSPSYLTPFRRYSSC